MTNNDDETKGVWQIEAEEWRAMFLESEGELYNFRKKAALAIVLVVAVSACIVLIMFQVVATTIANRGG